MTKTGHDVEQTKRLMGALLRMAPKPHSEMKLGKPKAGSTNPPNTRSKKERGKDKRKPIEKSFLGFSPIIAAVPRELIAVMRDNSKALEEITNKSRGSRSPKRKRG